MSRTITIPLKEYQELTSLRELVTKSAITAGLIPSGGEAKPPKEKVMSRAKLMKHFEKKYPI